MSFNVSDITQMSDLCAGAGYYVNENLLGTAFPFYGSSPLAKFTYSSGSCSYSTYSGGYYPQQIVLGSDGAVYNASLERIACKNNFTALDCYSYYNDYPNARGEGIDIGPTGKIYVPSNSSSASDSGLFIFDGDLNLQYHYLSSGGTSPIALKYAKDVAIAYPVAFVTTDDGLNTLQAINIDDTAPPSYLGKLDQGGGACSRINLDLDRCVAYIGCSASFKAIDISDPMEMEAMCGISTNQVEDMAIDYPNAALAHASYGLRLVDISGTHATVHLQFPADGCTQVGDTPSLKWTAKTRMLGHYELYIGKISNDLSLVASNIHNGPTDLVEYQVHLEPNTQYFWKVIADVEHCGYAESEIWNFTTSALPSAPALISPQHGMRNINPDSNLTLDWGDVTNATYDLYFGTTNPPTFHISTSTSSTHSITTAELDACTIYYWRVVAKTSCVELFSSTSWFATGGTCPVSGTALILSSSTGTTAGGAELVIYALAAIDAPPAIAFYDGSDCSGENAVWVDSEDILDWDATNRWIRLRTPRFIESLTSILVDNSINSDICQSDAYNFHTLAYSANQGGHGISVVDTADFTRSSPLASMSMTTSATPSSLAYNINWGPGRTLYTLDGVSGDMECHDASNFLPKDIDDGTAGVQNILVLQDPETTPATPTAFDLGLFYFGDRVFVSHVTAGTDTGTNPTPGGLSLVWIIGDEAHIPILMDLDGNAQTTSPGAPAGVTRAVLCVGDPPDCATGNNEYFYPLSVEVVNLALEAGHTFEEGEPYPGEYAFVSGVGYKDGSADRAAMAAVVDLNAFLYCDPALHRPGYCYSTERFQCWGDSTYCNPRYWETLQAEEGYANYKTFAAGTDNPATLGDTKHAMDFAPDSWIGETELGPTLYLANQHENAAYLFQYDAVNWDWVPVLDEYEDPITIATGSSPSGVKVQTVLDDTYVYITNAGDDNVTVLDTATNEEVPDDSPIYQDYAYGGCLDSDHLPVAMDARSTGDRGYSVDKSSGTVSVFDLPNNQMAQSPDSCEISTGSGSEPVDIVVQPVPRTGEFFEQMMGMMVFSATTDYAAPEDQAEIIGDWKAIRQLELTPASPQAIKAALDAYLNKIDQKVCKDKLNKHLKQGAKLYRAAYLHDHPGN